MWKGRWRLARSMDIFWYRLDTSMQPTALHVMDGGLFNSVRLLVLLGLELPVPFSSGILLAPLLYCFGACGNARVAACLALRSMHKIDENLENGCQSLSTRP